MDLKPLPVTNNPEIVARCASMAARRCRWPTSYCGLCRVQRYKRANNGSPLMDMTIEERVVGSVVVLDLSGKLVLGDGDSLLKDKVHSLVFQGKKQIVLNLGGVSYVDSSGLGALVSSSMTAKSNGGQIKVANLTKRIHDLLSIAKLLTVFESFESDSDAVNSFSAGAGA